MKRLFGCVFLIFSLLLTLSAQDVNEQYETFSWQPVAKAREYEVVVEKYDSIAEIWKDYKVEKTTETSLELLFTPGTYRVAIATYNLIGRRGKQSQWVTFKILEEHIPYLNEKFLPKNKLWNAPVLFISRNGAGPSDSESQNYITAPPEFPGTNILIKGHNIFSPKTEFYLIPQDEAPAGAVEYINYCDDRREQKLKILQRNSKDYSVIVSYDEKTLHPGYYALEVRNPGDNSARVELLVLDDSRLTIAPEKGFEIDEHYNVNSFTIDNSSIYEFSVEGTGIYSGTSYYLEPVSGAVPYPFETMLPREKVSVEVTGFYKRGNSKAQITLSCSTENLKTGYYNLVAQNSESQTSKFLFLVKRPFDNDYTKNIKKIKTKFNKKTEFVEVTITDDKLNASKTYTLVSQYNEGLDANYKVNVPLTQSGKKLTGTLTPDQLSIAKYALMIEDAYSSDVIYCDIDNTLRLSPQKMSSLEIERTFFRPINAGGAVTLDVDDSGAIQFTDNKIEMIKRMPMLFTNFAVNMSLLKDNSTLLNTELDIFNCGFASVSTGLDYIIRGDENKTNLFTTIRLALPNNYVKPYIGIGIGQNLVFPDQPVYNFSGVMNMLLDKNQTYFFAQAGVMLFTIIDVRYNLYLNNAFVSPYFTEAFSVGFSFPLRAYKFKRKVISRKAAITKPGQVDAGQFIEPSANVDELSVYIADSVGGFTGYNFIEEVYIDNTISVIQTDAFRECSKLLSVSFNNDYSNTPVPLTIKSGAFAGDVLISSIQLPERTSVVESGAFAEWTDGQIIKLSWNKDDETPRDLRGLDNCSATVVYANGDLYTKNLKTPLLDATNWISINELDIENVSVHKDNIYTLGINLSGFGEKWYRQELYTWINQESPLPVIDYIRSGEKICFKVQGDGNKYDFIIATQDGGYFYYRFKTQKDKVTTVEIPYKKLKKYNFSSEKKLDMDKIKMICILPMCRGEWNDVSFFEFEVK